MGVLADGMGGKSGGRKAADQVILTAQQLFERYAPNRDDPTEALKQLTYLAAALKAPRITEAAARLADHARDAGWTHEEYLAAVLDREVAARNASGAQLRIRAAGFSV